MLLHIETRKSLIFTQMLYHCFSRVQPVAALFFQFCWLETHIYAAIDFLNFVINWVQLLPVEAIALEKCSWEFWAAAYEQCCAHYALVYAWDVLLKGKLLSTTWLITANICWGSTISHQYCPLTFHFRLDKEQLPLLSQLHTLRNRWVCSNRQ